MIQFFDINEQKHTRATLTSQVSNLQNLVSDHHNDLSNIKEIQQKAENLLSSLKKKTTSTEQLVILGFLILAFTTLGIAISFLSLVIDVYKFIHPGS
jgi:uncharacterized protein (UPF0305 family)